MKLGHDNLLYRITGVIRFVIARIWYARKLQVKRLCLFGKSFSLAIPGKGKVIFEGRVICQDHAQLFSKGVLTIGNGCTINRYSRIVCHERINIGRNVTIAQFVSILDHDHGYEMTEAGLRLHDYTIAPVTIGNNVWISDKVTILKGVNIGNNVIIAANSVVTKDIESNVIAGGIPAKVLKSL